VFWPLIGAFIAFVLLAIVIGWWVDPDRAGDSGQDGHHSGH
jgi:hypothetical protein